MHSSHGQISGPSDHAALRLGPRRALPPSMSNANITVSIPSTLTAQLATDGWHVVDDAGGTWWPDAEAAAEILASEDPAHAALAICASDPMRGTWHA